MLTDPNTFIRNQIAGQKITSTTAISIATQLERSHLMPSRSGIESMVAELLQDTELFQELDREVEKIIEPLHAQVGLARKLCDGI
jgi:hypothetical protein